MEVDPDTEKLKEQGCQATDKQFPNQKAKVEKIQSNTEGLNSVGKPWQVNILASDIKNCKSQVKSFLESRKTRKALASEVKIDFRNRSIPKTAFEKGLLEFDFVKESNFEVKKV